MPQLGPGTRLGVYEISEQIGAGGMGEVYRATDTRLKRQVALKVLPALVTADPERLARFEREAEVLASLNHPNIAALYGVEESGSTRALVMELVDGPTLADRIAQGPMAIGEALSIAQQIAAALAAAHEQGIVHRDLKPANIKLRSGDEVKVLDFGLAKAMEPGTSIGDSISGRTYALTKVSTAGGAPRWSSDGRAVYFLTNGSGGASLQYTLTTVPVTTQPSFTMGTPVVLGEVPFPSYDVSTDGRILLSAFGSGASAGSARQRIVVVQHWVDDLRSRIAAGR